MESGKPLPMFLNHNDMGMPVGEWNEFVFDKEGMTAKGKLFLNTSAGNDLYTVLKESPDLFGGVSVGAYAEEACWVDTDGNPIVSGDDDAESYFQITKGGLREVSVVMYPNNPNAEIHKLEAFDVEGNANPRVIEKLLREAGVSRKDATTASSILKKLLALRDATPEVKQEAPIARDADAVDQEAQLLRAFELRELEKALSKRI
jgi:HK97 family phage prohead protease